MEGGFAFAGTAARLSPDILSRTAIKLTVK
jgi:hypothetical protein